MRHKQAGPRYLLSRRVLRLSSIERLLEKYVAHSDLRPFPPGQGDSGGYEEAGPNKASDAGEYLTISERPMAVGDDLPADWGASQSRNGRNCKYGSGAHANVLDRGDLGTERRGKTDAGA